PAHDLFRATARPRWRPPRSRSPTRSRRGTARAARSTRELLARPAPRQRQERPLGAELLRSPDLDDDPFVWIGLPCRHSGGDRAPALRRGSALSIAGSSSLEGGLVPDRVSAGDAGVAGWISAELQQNVVEPIADFQNPDQEWR